MSWIILQCRQNQCERIYICIILSFVVPARYKPDRNNLIYSYTTYQDECNGKFLHFTIFAFSEVALTFGMFYCLLKFEAIVWKNQTYPYG